MAVLRDTQVTVQQLPQVDQVLVDQRLVEPVLMIKSLDNRGVAERALAQVGGCRVARDQVGQNERHQRDAYNEDYPNPEPAAQETPEPGGGNPPGSGSASAVYCDCSQLVPSLARFRMSTNHRPLAWRSLMFLVPTITSAGWMMGMNGPSLLTAFWNFSKTA